MKIHKVSAGSGNAPESAATSAARPVAPMPESMMNAEPDEQMVQSSDAVDQPATAGVDTGRPKEIGGPKGPEPTRYGDWERKGRCVDF